MVITGKPTAVIKKPMQLAIHDHQLVERQWEER